MNRVLPLVLLALAAARLHAQAAPDGARLVPIARTADGDVLALDSASVTRSGDSSFVARTVTTFAHPIAFGQDSADRREDTRELDCASLRTRAIAMAAYRGGSLAQADVHPHPWRAAADGEAPALRALCDALEGFFADLPVEREAGDDGAGLRMANAGDMASEIQRAFAPVLAQTRSPSGMALLRLRVLPDGTVDRRAVRVLAATAPEFGDAAVRVTRKMHFNPARDHGQPVAVWVNLPVAFELQN